MDKKWHLNNQLLASSSSSLTKLQPRRWETFVSVDWLAGWLAGNLLLVSHVPGDYLSSRPLELKHKRDRQNDGHAITRTKIVRRGSDREGGRNTNNQQEGNELASPARSELTPQDSHRSLCNQRPPQCHLLLQLVLPLPPTLDPRQCNPTTRLVRLSVASLVNLVPHWHYIVWFMQTVQRIGGSRTADVFTLSNARKRDPVAVISEPTDSPLVGWLAHGD